jgi:hypothetical protein
LGLDRIGAGADKGLYFAQLLEPLKQLTDILPTNNDLR